MKQPKAPEGPKPSPPVTLPKWIYLVNHGFGKSVTAICCHCGGQQEMSAPGREIGNALLRAFKQLHLAKNPQCRHSDKRHGPDCHCKSGKKKKTKREQLTLPGC